MKPAFPRWKSSALILICERCFKERIPLEDPDKARQIGDFHLRDWIKTKLKDDGLWGPIRAVNTSCMDVCPRRAVTVLLDAQAEGVESECVIVDPVLERDQLYAEIVKRFGA
jgi:hypothetical protein